MTEAELAERIEGARGWLRRMQDEGMVRREGAYFAAGTVAQPLSIGSATEA